ncbi:MAG: hypothetical protein E7554_06175 [Ruminococcaceae bacterium]|nr:hypothetical protein [Oscillospiraceae bacterium]
MKKIALRIAAAVMTALMLVSVVGCAEAEPVRHEVDGGLSIVLPADFESVEVEGFAHAIANDDVCVFFVRESFDSLAAMGIEDITLEEYARLYEVGYGLESRFAPDAGGNLVTTYDATVEGCRYFYYSTLREDTDCFWTISFACEEEDRDIYADLFAVWNSTITVE